jgi:hypothetical protein
VHRVITDGRGHVDEVRGEAVVGLYPVVTPGCDGVVYQSCTKLQHAPGSMQVSMPYSCTQKSRIVTLRFGTGRQKLFLERWTHPKPQRRTRSPRYEVPSCRGKSAGVAKRPRERSPTRNPAVTIRNFFVAVGPGLLPDTSGCARAVRDLCSCSCCVHTPPSSECHYATPPSTWPCRS